MKIKKSTLLLGLSFAFLLVGTKSYAQTDSTKIEAFEEPKTEKQKRNYDSIEEEVYENDDEVIVITRKKKMHQNGVSITKKVNRFIDNLPDKLYRVDDYVLDQIHGRGNRSSSEVIEDLHVFNNNPDNGLLNVQFFSSSKEKVEVKILDLDGKLIQSVTFDNFEGGEFFTQIKIDEALSGTFIIIVKQNEEARSQEVRL